MKKGISLIVLVITIIVMIIIAGAIILSLSNGNVIAKGNLAKLSNDRASLQELMTSRVSEYMSGNEGSVPVDITAANTASGLAAYTVPTMQPTTKGVWYVVTTADSTIISGGNPAYSVILKVPAGTTTKTQAIALLGIGGVYGDLPVWITSSTGAQLTNS